MVSLGIFFPTALVDGDARVIAQASDFGSQNAVVYVVRTPFAAEHPDILKDVLEDLRESARWAQQNREEAARLRVQEPKLSPRSPPGRKLPERRTRSGRREGTGGAGEPE